jgi:Tol biopolymer transport system component
MKIQVSLAGLGGALALVAALAVVPASSGAQASLENGRIAFNSNRAGDQEIYTMKANGTDVRRLTDNPASDVAPEWSPDGTKIVFTSTRDGNREIYVMNADGSDVRRLTNHPALDSRPDWSVDGTKIVFVSARIGGFHPVTGLPLRGVFVMNADGTGVTQLTAPEDALDNGPRFSPDGTKIAFLRVQANGRMAVYTIDSDGSNERKLTPDSLNAAEPDWSPDGTKLAAQNNTCPLPECAGESDVILMNADGSGISSVTNNMTTRNGLASLQPRWSPEGNKLVYHVVTTDPSDFSFDIATITPHGTALKSLTSTPGVDDSNPAWGPAAPGE